MVDRDFRDSRCPVLRQVLTPVISPVAATDPRAVDAERLRLAHTDWEALRIRIHDVHAATEAAEHGDGAGPRCGVDVRAPLGLPQYAPCRHIMAGSEKRVEIQNDLLAGSQPRLYNRHLLQFRIRDHLDDGWVEASFTE